MNPRRSLLLPVVFALVLAACATPATPAPPVPLEWVDAPVMKSAIDARIAQIDGISLSKDNPTEIVFTHRYSSVQLTGLQEIVNDFNTRNPYGIEVKLERVEGSYEDLYNHINTRLQNGSPPDIGQAYQNQASFYRNNGSLLDLTPYTQSRRYGLKPEEADDFYPLFLESDKNPHYPGETLGWPTARSLDVLYSNLDWLQRLGASAPPESLDEFKTLACKASDKAAGTVGYIWRDDASDFAAFVFAHGGSIMTPDAQRYAFNSEAGVKALTLLRDLFRDGCAIAQPRSERNRHQARFAAQEVLFVTDSSAGLPFYAEAIQQASRPFRYTASMFPQADPATPKVDLYGASWSVFKSTPEKQLASWLFLKHFTDTYNIAKWAQVTNYIATRKSAATIAVDKVRAGLGRNFPEAAVAYDSLYDQLQYAAVESPVAGYDPVRRLIVNMVNTVAIQGQGDPQAALDETVAQANEVLKENAPER
jgi:ABC-type glycerol-3-phosphate transport system substrate-binding protein